MKPAAGGACVAALDVGTTAVKACLFSPSMALLACEVQEYSLRTEGGRVEADGDTYLAAAGAAMRRAAAKAPGWRPAALAMTTQGETLAPVDSDGMPLRPFLVWLDGRAEAQAARLRRALPGRVFYEATGLPEITGALPLAKAAWLQEEEPAVFARAKKILLLEDWLLRWATGRWAGEKSLHTSTGWFCLHSDGVWDEALAAAGLPRRMLPELTECGAIVGPLLDGPAAALGLPAGIPVAAGAMDQTAAALATGGFSGGCVTETTGTALVAAVCTDRLAFPAGHPVTLYRHARAGKYLYLPIGNTAGMALRWFRDNFCRDLPDGAAGYAALDAMAAGAQPGCGGLVFLPFLAGSVDPDACPAARGVFFGAGLATTRAHFARSVLEGVAFLLRDCLALLEPLAGPAGTVYSLGGGARSAVWMQIKADVCGRAFTVPACTEATAMGAALLAAWAVGLVPDGQLPKAEPAARYEPRAADAGAYEAAYGLYRDVYAALRPLYERGAGGQ